MNQFSASKRLHSGFSLIEIMVVVVIVGLLVGVLSLSLGSFAEDQNQENARRLEALIELVRDEAGIQGREYGLTFYQQGYEFAVRGQVLDEKGFPVSDEKGLPVFAWFPIEQDRLLRPRALDEDSFLDLELEGKEVVLKFERDPNSTYQPQIFLLSSGEVEPPFHVWFRKSFSESGFEIEYDLNGLVEAADEEI